MKKISFGDLKIGDIARDRINKALNKNWVSEGENVKEFEEKFAKHFGYKYAVAVSSGTDACIASLLTLYDFGAKRGDEVIVPACTFAATANAVLAAGFVPKFVDINLETLNIDVEQIEKHITDKTCALMPVHLMGKPCDMDRILSVAKIHELKVIEDCCEAHGAKYKNKYVGTIGDMGAFSFYVAHIVVCGEGGMVVTDNGEIADVVRSVKSHGRPTGSLYFDFQRHGLNLKMNDLTAAVGIEAMEYFDETFDKRKNNMKRLLDLLSYYHSYFYFIKEESYEVVSPHAFPVVLKETKYDCKNLYGFLEQKGIQCKTIFGSLPNHNAFKHLGYEKGCFPNAEYVGKHGLHFGIHQYLSDEDLVFISNMFDEYFLNKETWYERYARMQKIQGY